MGCGPASCSGLAWPAVAGLASIDDRRCEVALGPAVSEGSVAMHQKERGRSLVGPVILIGLGMLFLLENFGLLDWGVWETLLRLWPVFVIAAGLDLLLGRGSLLGSLFVLALVGGIVVAVIFVSGMPVAWSTAVSSETISQPLGNASQADVEIGSGVGTLRLGALEDPQKLVEGTVSLSGGQKAASDFYTSGDTAFFRLRSKGTSRFPADGRPGDFIWDLKLNNTVPTRLRVNTGVGVTIADLSQVKLTELEYHGGVGKTDLALPGRGQYQARIEGGVGEVTVSIPSGMAASIRVETGLGDVRVSGDYQRQGSYYVSPGYETATDRVDLRVNGGIGRIVVRQLSSAPVAFSAVPGAQQP